MGESKLAFSLFFAFLIASASLHLAVLSKGGDALVVVTSDDPADLISSSVLSAAISAIIRMAPTGIIAFPWKKVYLVVVPLGTYDEAYLKKILELKPATIMIVGNNTTVPEGYDSALKNRGLIVERIDGKTRQERSISVYKAYVRLFNRLPPGLGLFLQMRPVLVDASDPRIPWGSFPIWFISVTDELVSFIGEYKALAHSSLKNRLKGVDVSFTDVELVRVLGGVKGFRVFSQDELTLELKEAYLPKTLPKFVKHVFTDLSKIRAISKFRSCAGHEYRDAFERGSSLKHYYKPYDEYKNTKDVVKVYSPVDGTIIAIFYEWGRLSTGEPRGMHVIIAVDGYPGFIVELFHINVLESIAIGMKVKAGDMIGYADLREANDFDIAVAFMSPIGHRYYSYFDVMKDSVFVKYRERGIVSRDQLKVPREERAKCPCDFTRMHPEDWVILSPAKKPVALVTLEARLPSELAQYQEVEFEVLISNLGEVDAREVRVKVIEAKGLETEPTSIQVGVVKGKSQRGFRLRAKALAPGSGALVLQLSYLDEGGRRRVEKFTVFLKILESSGEFKVLEAPKELIVGSESTVKVTITNTGKIEAEYTLEVSGENVEVNPRTITVKLAPAESKELTLKIKALKEGKGLIKLKLLAYGKLLDSQELSLEIRSKGLDIMMVALALIAIIAVFAIILVFKKRARARAV